MADTEAIGMETVPMDEIAAGIRGLRIGFVNVFGVTHADGTWTLIDAGLPFSVAAIRRWAEKHFGGAPNAIVLTHGHFDHVSGAPELAREWNVPVIAHALEEPYLTGQKEYPAPNPGTGGGLMAVLSPLYPRGPVNLSEKLRLLPETLSEFAGGGEIAELPGWRVLHTPGHTPGHISLFRSSDLALIVGDAFCTTKPESFFDAAVAQPAELHGPPAYFTSDWQEAARSIRKLAEWKPRIVAPGHGKPLAGAELDAQFDLFASKFVSDVAKGQAPEPAR